MKNHRRPKNFRSFLYRNGFYIALVICVIAAAVASYSAVSNILDNLGDNSFNILPPPVPTPLPDDTTETIVDPVVPPVVEEPADVAEVVRPAETITTEPVDDGESVINSDIFIPVHIAPVAGAVAKSFSGDELVRSITMNDWRTHNGADYAAALGTEVVAIYSGEITFVGAHDILGNMVEIRLDSGYTARYCNLAPISGLRVGERVSQGQVIGTVGNSAILENGEEPHLHFEVFHYDKRIDPQSLY